MDNWIVPLIIAAVVIAAIVGFVATTRKPGTDVVDSSAGTTSPGRDAPTIAAEPAAEVDAGFGSTTPAPPEVEIVEPAVKPTFRDRLSRARGAMAASLGSLRGRSKIDQDAWDDLEEALLRADIGYEPATELLESTKKRVKAEGIDSIEGVIESVKAEMVTRLIAPIDLRFSDTAPSVWLFVGVNGVGKTTTIGKVGHRLMGEGHSAVMAAGDTFRAAAAEQLETWADRCGATFIRGSEGADPSAVIFDAIEHAASKGADVVLADTAGRLHTKSNLMDELAKVRRVADKGAGTVTEVLLVLDATTGQNGLIQAQQFAQAADLTGVVLTKLDGSAKGGIVFAIQQSLGIPVKLVGLGETAEDLVPFDAEEFVDALFATDSL